MNYFNEELKELRAISKDGAYMIKEIENEEREKTGVKSLKIGFNKVFAMIFYRWLLNIFVLIYFLRN